MIKNLLLHAFLNIAIWLFDSFLFGLSHKQITSSSWRIESISSMLNFESICIDNPLLIYVTVHTQTLNFTDAY